MIVKQGAKYEMLVIIVGILRSGVYPFKPEVEEIYLDENVVRAIEIEHRRALSRIVLSLLRCIRITPTDELRMPQGVLTHCVIVYKSY